MLRIGVAAVCLLLRATSVAADDYAAPSLPVLTRQLSDPDELTVRASLAALARLQSTAAPALPALRPLLAHDASEIRWATLQALGAIGPPARELVPDIEPFLRDGAVELRLAAADALRRIEPPPPLTAQRLAAHVAWLGDNVPGLMRQFHVPGVSIAIVRDGHVAWSQGFGVRDVRDGGPVTIETIFESGSLSKPAFAMVAMHLVQEGRLDPDRPLVDYLGRDYLPDFPEHRLITARMALAHRTGLPNWRLGYAEAGGPLALQLPPGSEYTYSGEGILFLQRAIEELTDEPLHRLSQRRSFEPLRLERTSFVWSERIEKDLASGHRADGSFKERTRYREPNGAYSLYTTPAEFARLMSTMVAADAAPAGGLTRASIERMLRKELRIDDEPVARPGRSRPVATYRALGWKIDVTADGDIVWHSGSNSSGFKAYAQLNPAKRSGLVIFANGDGGYRLRDAVLRQFGDL
jgi:CubicO group peptidase (beta-lactamase class C family)